MIHPLSNSHTASCRSRRPGIYSVGSLAIDRFLRPVYYQNLPAALLPSELRDGAAGPRLVDGQPA